MKTFDEVWAERVGTGWLTEDEARLLWESAQLTDGAILEVGVHHGRSACVLAALGRQLIVVDPWDGSIDAGDPGVGDRAFESFKGNLLRLGHTTNVFINRCKVEDWCPGGNYPKVGYAYLDGDHSREATLRQIAVARLCRADAIAVHDVGDSGTGGMIVKAACLEALGAWSERVDSLAVWRMKP